VRTFVDKFWVVRRPFVDKPFVRMAWGSETGIRSRGGAVILVDQPAKQIPPANFARTDRHRVPRLGSWRGEVEGAMGSPAVVVLDIGPERPIEMPPTSG
jgi:hypothetical protein